MTDVRLARAYLSRVAEPPCAALAALVGRVGPVEAAQRVRRGAVRTELRQLTSARRDADRAAEDLDRVTRLGGRLVTPEDAEWPVVPFAAFGGVDTRRHPGGIAPLALWVIGETTLAETSQRAAAGTYPWPPVWTLSSRRTGFPMVCDQDPARTSSSANRWTSSSSTQSAGHRTDAHELFRNSRACPGSLREGDPKA